MQKSKGMGNSIVCSLDLKTRYDLVISNPPYYKLNKSSPEALALQEYVYGQPNIYAFFMLLSGMLLDENGGGSSLPPEALARVFIIQKSEDRIVKTMTLDRLHLFETRKDVFVDDEILQENLIFHATNIHPKSGEITFDQYQAVVFGNSPNTRKMTVPSSDVAYCQGRRLFYPGFPPRKTILKFIEIIDSWPQTLNSLGFEISTGPVVDFRARGDIKRDNRKFKLCPAVVDAQYQRH